MPKHQTKQIIDAESTLFDYPMPPGLGELHSKYDPETGLQSIVAIHSLRNGSALGGCRFLPYPTIATALKDVKRLAQAMSYKSAMCNLPYGGGKAVIIKPPTLNDRTNLFHAFGRFINDLNERYITTVDSGSRLADMADIATHTPFVTAYEQAGNLNPDPSPHTALGVYRGIESALAFQLKKPVADAHVLIQGAGNVGYYLASLLHKAGATLSVSDINADLVERCVNEFKAVAITPEEVYGYDCDVYSPCALGAVLNETTIPQLKAHIIAGCANNQLATKEDGQRLQQRNILYAPDYVINAGGLIFVAQHYSNNDPHGVDAKISGIYDTLWDIFEKAQNDETATSDIADTMAAKRLSEHYIC